MGRKIGKEIGGRFDKNTFYAHMKFLNIKNIYYKNIVYLQDATQFCPKSKRKLDVFRNMVDPRRYKAK